MIKPESSKCSTIEATPPSPAPAPVQEQNFEFELPENIVRVPTPLPTATTEDLPPRFQDFQHPYVKLWVKFLALISFGCLIANALYRIDMQYKSILCPFLAHDISKCPTGTTFFEILELISRVVLEMIIPMVIIFFGVIVSLVFVTLPKLATKFHDPTPAFTPMAAVVIVYYAVTYLGYSLSMVSNLGSSHESDRWLRYFVVTVWGLFWMYAFINVQVFSKLSHFEQIRAREKWESYELARAQAVA